MRLYNIQLSGREVVLVRVAIVSRLHTSDLPPGERAELLNLLDYLDNETVRS